MLNTDYFSLCQSVILAVLSHEEIYLNICKNVRGVLTFVIHFIYIYIYISGAEMGLVLLVPGTTNNSVNVIQNGLKIIH